MNIEIPRPRSFLPCLALAGLLLQACASSSPRAGAPGNALQAHAPAPASGSLESVAAALGDPAQNPQGPAGLAQETQERRERIEHEATTLADARKQHRRAHVRREHTQACRADEPQDDIGAVFCGLWIGASGHPQGKHRVLKLSRTPWGRKRLHELERDVARGRVDQLAQANDAEIRETIKKTHRKGIQLRAIVENALDNQTCAPVPLLTSLGFKSEESFPDPDYRELAEALYTRAGECGGPTLAADAIYRLGLLEIWDQRYDEAAKTLTRIVDAPEASDYRSRVAYWTYFCAKQTGDSALRDRMKGVLAKDYHLTLHGLITAGPKPTDNHPTVALVSAIKPQLNTPVRVAEALLEQGDTRDAVAALDPVIDEMPEAEPPFQLYVGLLLTRAGDSIHKFKVLTSLFRSSPGYLSRESLELLFPLYRFEVVQQYEQKADPFLVISLIRQESAFNEHARSPVGALGLMQLMPRTARRMEKVSRRALYNPDVNIRLGVRFFSRLTARYDGDAELALAAYNAGPENVDNWQERYPVSNRLLFVDLIPVRETREYVASIARNYYWYKKLYEEVRKPSSQTGQAGPTGQNSQSPPEKQVFAKLFDS